MLWGLSNVPRFWCASCIAGGRCGEVWKAGRGGAIVRPVQFIDFRLSCFVGQTVGSLECVTNMQATLQGLVALSIVQKLVPRSMVNPIASISSQPVPCVQQKVLMLQKRVKELEAICHRDSTQMMCQCSSCQIPHVFGEFLLWFPWEWCMLARISFMFTSCMDPCEAATLLLSVLQTCNMYGWSMLIQDMIALCWPKTGRLRNQNFPSYATSPHVWCLGKAEKSAPGDPEVPLSSMIYPLVI